MRKYFLLGCLLTGCLCFAHAQHDMEITITKTDWQLGSLITYLEQNYEVVFSYSTSIIALENSVKLDIQSYKLADLLQKVADQAGLEVKQQHNKVLLKKIISKEKYTISGYMMEKSTGEIMIGATIRVKGTTIGVISNAYGFYSLSLPAGQYVLEISYVSFETAYRTITLDKNLVLNIALVDAATALDEVVVIADQEPVNILSNVDYQQFNADFVKDQPALVGEPDIIKALQTIPGFKAGTEGSSGLSVRGGGRDQNLILLDEAVVYNPSHLFGFYSVFNPDAIKDVKAYKSTFPAQYGGRLSSVIDIKMKEGNNQQFEGEGAVGLISSKLTLQGPIEKGKSAFIISGRRTYADLFLKLDPEDGGNNVYFYDLNAKVNYTLGENDRLYLSGYFGHDLLRFFDQYESNWENQTATLRWNHVFNPKLFSNTSLIYSNYLYHINYFQKINTTQDFGWQSRVKSINLKSDFTYFLNPNHTVSSGVSWMSTAYKPGESNDESTAQNISPTHLLELSGYAQNEHTFNTKLAAEYGVRFSAVANAGNNTFYQFDQHFKVSDTLITSGITNAHFRVAPRVAVKSVLDPEQTTTIKAGYMRTYQFMQTLTNATLSFSAFDINMPITPNTHPLHGDQFSLATQKSFMGGYQLSVEGYYKWMKNVIDYEEQAQLIQNPLIEGEIRSGNGKAYGIEVMLEKLQGEFTGNIAYVFSKSQHKIKGINAGKWYNSSYDRPHQVNLSMAYKPAGRWRFFSYFTYSSGNATTYPSSFFSYGDRTVPIYNQRNTDRLPDYHRLDISAKLKCKNKRGKVSSYWEFSIYNFYARVNPVNITFGEEEFALLGEIKPGADIMAKKVYLFLIIPSFSYHIKF